MKHSDVDILLVEDNSADVQMALYALQKNNISSRVEVVRDGAQALDFVFARGIYLGRDVEDAPRLILLDLKLPRVNGLEVLRQIKSDPRTRCVPVVVLTTSNEERDVHEAYGLGANSYLVKPLNFDDFAEAVRNLGVYWLMLNQPPNVQLGKKR